MHAEVPEMNKTLQSFAHILVPPTQLLFRPAHPAVRRSELPHVFLHSRQDATCAEGETACENGGWCCGNGDTCSFEQNTYFCCQAGSGAAGCARVCAAGDFQCGSICCANGQSCAGADSASPFCMDSAISSSILTSTSTTSTSSLTTLSTIAISPSASFSIPASIIPSLTTSASAILLATSSLISSTIDDQSPTPVATATDSSTTTATNDNNPPSGLPLAAQIAIGIIVPVVVITLVMALWLLVFRKKASKSNRPKNPDAPPYSNSHHTHNPTRDSDASFYSTGPPPPAYGYGHLSEKNRTITVTETVTVHDDDNTNTSPNRSLPRRSSDLFEMVALDEETGTHRIVRGTGRDGPPRIGLTIDTERAEAERRRGVGSHHLHMPSLDAGEVSPTSVLPPHAL